MKLRLMAMLLTAPLCACADTYTMSGPPGSSSLNPALSVIETPFYVMLKIPTCIAAAPLLLPGAAASAIVPFDGKEPSGGGALVSGVKNACGAPWVAEAKYDPM
jgi:hypothetical protein